MVADHDRIGSQCVSFQEADEDLQSILQDHPATLSIRRANIFLLTYHSLMKDVMIVRIHVVSSKTGIRKTSQ